MATTRQTAYHMKKRLFGVALSLVATGLILVMTASTPAAAQSSSPTFSVEPVEAGPGVARRISIGLITGCDPTPTIVGNEITRTRTLTVRLEQPNPFFCDQLVRRSASISFTPDTEGELRVLVVTDQGGYVGEVVIRTRAANGTRSLYDLTGMWYDPASYGSGLTFVHGFIRQDALFGTWFVYDAAGEPRWYTIQNVVWKAGGLEAEGLIYETSANPGLCTPTLCPPVAFATVMPVARARIVMQGVNSAQIQAISLGGTVLLRLNIIRAIF